MLACRLERGSEKQMKSSLAAQRSREQLNWPPAWPPTHLSKSSSQSSSRAAAIRCLWSPSPQLTATCCRLTPRLPRRHQWGWHPRPCCSNVVSATAATERRADHWAGCAHAEHYGCAGGGQHSEDQPGPGGPGQGGPPCLLQAAMCGPWIASPPDHGCCSASPWASCRCLWTTLAM